MDFELRRKAFHVSLGILVLLLIYYELFYLIPAALVLLAGTGLSLLSREREVPIVESVLEVVERDHHRERFPGKGPISALAAVIIVAGLFDRGVALAAVAALTFGDALSHLVGVNFGSVPNPLNREKDLEGFMAGFLATSAVSSLFLHPYTAVSASFAGMVVESFDARIGGWSVSDNFTVPLAVASAAYLFQIYALPVL